MAVTDRQAAALRAQLAGKRDEHKHLFSQLDWSAEGPAYVALMDAAFFKAVDQRFGGGRSTTDDVINYVADVRARLDTAADAIDPAAAERLILKVLGYGLINDLDSTVAFRAKNFLLAALITDEQLDDSGLDEFMTQARKLADQWLT
ncbi:MAG TPA: hypothetical protein VGM53_22175 [Streptosporangiaceae bacterium]